MDSDFACGDEVVRPSRDARLWRTGGAAKTIAAYIDLNPVRARKLRTPDLV